MREATQGTSSVVGPIAAVLAVQHVRQADHERDLDALLHVLQASIHSCRRKGNPHENAQPACKSLEILRH